MQETSGITPQALESRPELWPENEIWMEAFSDLSLSRPMGMNGCGAIPLTEILAWCEITGTSDVEKAMRRIRAMDREYINKNKERA